LTKKLGIFWILSPLVCTPTNCAKFLEKLAKFLISQNWWGGKIKKTHAHNNMGGIQLLLLLP